MSNFIECDKCKKRIQKPQIEIIDCKGTILFDLCFDCFGLFGDWLGVEI